MRNDIYALNKKQNAQAILMPRREFRKVKPKAETNNIMKSLMHWYRILDSERHK